MREAFVQPEVPEGLQSMKAAIDVLGLGVVAVDDILHVESYPPPDAKAQVTREERQCGGLAATALVAAARLGSSCAYAGVLGEDGLSKFVLERFHGEGIDTSHAVIQKGACPVHSTIVVDTTRKTRNIFFHVGGLAGAHPELPEEAVIRASRVLMVDHFGIEGMIRAATIARSAKIPVVADFERGDFPRFQELLGLADHLILSRGFALELTGEWSPGVAARALWAQDREAVVITDGSEGAWFIDRADPRSPRRQPAFRVDAVDTTGCGDVFHGAYSSALARGEGLAERIRFASAAAALKVTRPGGQAGIPSRSIVESFLKDRVE
jgi:sugar/nucleoside kinase (ribokinase family)